MNISVPWYRDGERSVVVITGFISNIFGALMSEPIIQELSLSSEDFYAKLADINTGLVEETSLLIKKIAWEKLTNSQQDLLKDFCRGYNSGFLNFYG